MGFSKSDHGINVSAIEAYGRSYASFLGFVIDDSLDEDDADYHSAGTVSLKTEEEGNFTIVSYTNLLMERLMADAYRNGRTASPNTFLPGTRYNCKVERNDRHTIFWQRAVGGDALIAPR